MELTQLKYFITVAEKEHVTKSAQELHIAQPALTQAIHHLEEELEVPLFYRQGRNIKLTAYGEYFYKKLIPIMQQLNLLPESLKAMAKKEDSTIHLNVLAASSLVTEAIIEYQHIDDSLHIDLMQSHETDLSDINVTTTLFHGGDVNEHDSTFVCTEKIFLAVPNIERYKKRKSITLEEVKDEGFIALSGSRQLRAICDKYCEDSHIKPNIIFESDSPQAVKNMIAASIGVGFWPAFSWEKLNTDRVKLLEITNPKCSRDILITYKKNKINNEKSWAFYKFLTKYFKLAKENKL